MGDFFYHGKKVAAIFIVSLLFACAPATNNDGDPEANKLDGNTGVFSVRVQGNELIDGFGNPLQLRGANFSGFESVAIGGWDPGDPSGGQAGQAYGPKWSAMTSAWKMNVVRLPLNEASWLGYTCTDTSGNVINPDPGANYKSSVKTQVQEAIAAGMYVILDLHWAAPGTTCPLLQTQMADTDHSLSFWTSVATTFKSNPAVLFELYNEPYTYGNFPLIMNGGTLTDYPATSLSSNWKDITANWTVAGMQSMLNAIRATGATNVVLVGGDNYNNDLSGWLANMPSDSLKQMAAAWHPYPPEQTPDSVAITSAGTGYSVGDTITLAMANTVYEASVLKVTSVSSGAVTGVSVSNAGIYLQTKLPTTALAQASTSGTGHGATFTLSNWQNYGSNWSMPSNWPTVLQISAKVPLIISETGEHNQAGTVGSPWLQELLPWADTNGISYLGWTWDVWGNYDNVLIKDANGTATDGYGVYFQQHLVCVGNGGKSCP